MSGTTYSELFLRAQEYIAHHDGENPEFDADATTSFWNVMYQYLIDLGTSPKEAEKACDQRLYEFAIEISRLALERWM